MVERGDVAVHGLNEIVIDLFFSTDRFGDCLNELTGSIAQGGGAVEYRCNEGVVNVRQKKPGSLDLYFVMSRGILAASGEVILIGGSFLRLFCDRDIALGFGVGDLYVIGQKILCEQPGSEYLL